MELSQFSAHIFWHNQRRSFDSLVNYARTLPILCRECERSENQIIKTPCMVLQKAQALRLYSSPSLVKPRENVTERVHNKWNIMRDCIRRRALLNALRRRARHRARRKCRAVFWRPPQNPVSRADDVGRRRDIREARELCPLSFVLLKSTLFIAFLMFLAHLVAYVPI